MTGSRFLPIKQILFPLTKGVAPYRGVGMEVSGCHWSFSASYTLTMACGVVSTPIPPMAYTFPSAQRHKGKTRCIITGFKQLVIKYTLGTTMQSGDLQEISGLLSGLCDAYEEKDIANTSKQSDKVMHRGALLSQHFLMSAIRLQSSSHFSMFVLRSEKLPADPHTTFSQGHIQASVANAASLKHIEMQGKERGGVLRKQTWCSGRNTGPGK